MENKSGAGMIAARIILILWALTVILPVFWILYVSLKTNAEFFQNIWALPEIPQWKNYYDAWTKLGIGSSMINTVYYVGGGLILGLFGATISSYVLTRLEWKGKKVVVFLVLISLFLPGINILVPQYVLMRSFHLTEKIIGIILLTGLPIQAFDFLIMSGFMKTIPKEMEESAFMDGATIFQTFRNIIIPLSVPGIITIAIFKFLGLFNDFINPFIYLTDPDKYTIGVRMYDANILMQYKADWVTLCAGVVIAMAPCIIVYMFLQKRIVEGATIGAVKA